MRTALSVLGRVLALAVGMILGFFVASSRALPGRLGFSDAADAIVFVFVVYVVTGVIFGASGRRYGWKWSFWLAPPGVVVLLTSLFGAGDEPLIYILAALLAVAAGSAGGSWVGAAIARSMAG